MAYYLDMNDGAGPKRLPTMMMSDVIIDQLVKKFKYRYRMRDANVTIVEKVV
jgi:hypothetical protein